MTLLPLLPALVICPLPLYAFPSPIGLLTISPPPSLHLKHHHLQSTPLFPYHLPIFTSPCHLLPFPLLLSTSFCHLFISPLPFLPEFIIYTLSLNLFCPPLSSNPSPSSSSPSQLLFFSILYVFQLVFSSTPPSSIYPHPLQPFGTSPYNLSPSPLPNYRFLSALMYPFPLYTS